MKWITFETDQSQTVNCFWRVKCVTSFISLKQSSKDLGILQHKTEKHLPFDLKSYLPKTVVDQWKKAPIEKAVNLLSLWFVSIFLTRETSATDSGCQLDVIWHVRIVTVWNRRSPKRWRQLVPEQSKLSLVLGNHRNIEQSSNVCS
jgi:hypothetical protein